MKKGLIFSLDAAIAVTILILVILNSMYYFSTSSTESLSQIQLMKIGEDIITAFDNDGTLDLIVTNRVDVDPPPAPITTTGVTPELPLETLLPPNYEMWVQILDVIEGGNTLISGGSGKKYGDLVIEESGDYPTQVHAEPGGNTGTIQTWIEWSSLPDCSGACTNCDPLGDDCCSPCQEVTVPKDTPPTWYLFGDEFHFEAGTNKIIFQALASATVDDFKVLGLPYFAATVDTPITIPNDRFIGSGDRVINVYNSNTNEWTQHWVRYLIWVTT